MYSIGSMVIVKEHTNSISEYCREQLQACFHHNGKPLVVLNGLSEDYLQSDNNVCDSSDLLFLKLYCYISIELRLSLQFQFLFLFLFLNDCLNSIRT